MGDAIDHMAMTKGTTRFFKRKTHAVVAGFAISQSRLLGRGLDVASGK